MVWYLRLVYTTLGLSFAFVTHSLDIFIEFLCVNSDIFVNSLLHLQVLECAHLLFECSKHLLVEQSSLICHSHSVKLASDLQTGSDLVLLIFIYFELLADCMSLLQSVNSVIKFVHFIFIVLTNFDEGHTEHPMQLKLLLFDQTICLALYSDNESGHFDYFIGLFKPLIAL